MKNDSESDGIKEHYNPLFENLGFCSMEIKKGEKVPKTTQGQEKLTNQLYEILRKESFGARIIKLRNKYQIPERGYGGYGEWEQVYDEEHDRWESIVVCNDFFCPEEWMGKEREKDMGNLNKDLVELCQKYKVPSEIGFDWFNIFRTYLFYDVIAPTVIFDLCRAVEYYSKEDDLASYREWRKINEKNFPVGIMVSPYASRRDIVDYVGKYYDSIIKPMQKKYKGKGMVLGKIRRKDSEIQERNSFIYENKDLPRKVIAQLVNKKYKKETLDYSSIGKIISREEKKRKIGH